MIQAKAKPSAKKIPRTGSNKIPRTEKASAGSAQNRGDHSRPAGVRRVEASQHREGQEEPSQEMSQCGSTGREYDGDIRVRTGDVPVLYLA